MRTGSTRLRVSASSIAARVASRSADPRTSRLATSVRKPSPTSPWRRKKSVPRVSSRSSAAPAPGRARRRASRIEKVPTCDTPPSAALAASIRAIACGDQGSSDSKSKSTTCASGKMPWNARVEA
ncbi:MAG: hypothetical protein A2V77_15035 [Anaeromyxobacter sp. RBG_16_69_14]|nr:MAG: hypothetical protein A2V77_15035 [Anaeromyxobacter sp. RBG_16_69_14]